MSEQPALTFAAARLPEPIERAVLEAGYETPTEIQAAAIGPLLAGHDVIGEAQTGTGKTAAFALPLLARLNLDSRAPQLLVLTPTRELAIQVAEAFARYARHLQGFAVACIYGGQPYGPQLGQLARGAQVVVGTPGRMLDHVRRGSLELATIGAVVLDEADEMLRMGFIEDVEAVLAGTRSDKQVALFSATMPGSIQAIADAHTTNAKTIRVEPTTRSAAHVEQTYWFTRGTTRLEALDRFLEVERTDGAIVFTRTKVKTEEVAAYLERAGYAAAALNGDMNQISREAVVARLRDGRLDIVVATDVAARGLDVERIGLVVNFEMPFDVESYVHRIGRTGRAGRSGKAIAFASGRDRGLLRAIERATRQRINEVSLPTLHQIALSREAHLSTALQRVSAERDLSQHRKFVESLTQGSPERLLEVATALAALAEGDRPLLEVPDEPSTAAADAAAAPRDGKHVATERGAERSKRRRADVEDFVRYRLDVGATHGARPKHIVGAIANEASLDSRYIGAVQIEPEFSVVELPAGMPKEIFRHLQKVRVCNRPLRLTPCEEQAAIPGRPKPRGSATKKPSRAHKHQHRKGQRRLKRDAA
ncbi:MAG: DEAD/DEAH box helicase [Pseudomonadota bacterium]